MTGGHRMHEIGRLTSDSHPKWVAGLPATLNAKPPPPADKSP